MKDPLTAMQKTSFNPGNDRMKRDYLIWLKEAKQRSEATVDHARHAIDRYETYTGFKDFGTFNKDQAVAFKTSLVETVGQRSAQPISIATVHHTLRTLRDFFAWLHGVEAFRRKIKPGDIAYLNLSTGDERRARTSAPKTFPTPDQFRRALFAMPSGTEVERRDQALMALLFLTGMRDAAVVGLKLQDVDLDHSYIFQDPRHARTKFSKAIDTFFLPVGDDVKTIFLDWVSFLIRDKGFGPQDPVFPKTVVNPGADQIFAPQGIGRAHWSNAAPVRKCFKAAFARVGLPFTKPHTVRDTLTQLAYSLRLDAQGMKAWSQNLGHDKPLTTFNSYGRLSREQQGKVIAALGQRDGSDALDDLSLTRLLEMAVAKFKSQGL